MPDIPGIENLDPLVVGTSCILGFSLLFNWISMGTINWATLSIKQVHIDIGLWRGCVWTGGHAANLQACSSDMTYRGGK